MHWNSMISTSCTVSRRIAESTADEKLIEQQFHRHGLALAESVGHLSGCRPTCARP
jgi:hypothetical protein